MAIKFNPLTGFFDMVGSSGGGGGSISGSGVANQLTYFNGATSVTGNANFTLDTLAALLKLGSGTDVLELTILTSNALASGAYTDSLLFTFPVAKSFAFVEYSIVRGTNLRNGTLSVLNDGVTVSVTDNFQEIGDTQISLASPEVAHSISGGNVEIRVTSIGGVAGTFKKSMRRWS